MTISKKQLAEAYERGRQEGMQIGYQQAVEAAAKSQAARDGYIKLVHAVGQAMNTQTTLLQGLASALDNGPR